MDSCMTCNCVDHNMQLVSEDGLAMQEENRHVMPPIILQEQAAHRYQ
jgi:hypothetical protein